jgi:hypothetical protein
MTEVKKSVDSNGIIHYGNPNDVNVRFTIDADKNTEHLEDKLEEKEAENRELSNKLEQIATLEFSKQCQQYGLDASTSTPEDLENAKAERKINRSAPTGQSETAQLNYQQLTGQTTYQLDHNSDLPIEMISAETPEELIAIANKKAQQGDKDSQHVLSQFTKKLVKGKGIDMEFEGDIRDFLRQEPIIRENDSNEVKFAKQAKIDRLKRNRTNWRELNDY